MANDALMPGRPATELPPPTLAVGRFGAVVRQLREGRGWSQERLAGEAELNRSYMGEVERGVVMPSLATPAKLAAALGVPLSRLLQHCEQSHADRAAEAFRWL